jgi:hypothetical protein
VDGRADEEVPEAAPAPAMPPSVAEALKVLIAALSAPADPAAMPAWTRVAERSEPTESFHFGVNSLVQNVHFALYRDFPDPQRRRGAERF